MYGESNPNQANLKFGFTACQQLLGYLRSNLVFTISYILSSNIIYTQTVIF